jgi:hypothetical protein
MKKIISIILVFAMLMSTVVFADTSKNIFNNVYLEKAANGDIIKSIDIYNDTIFYFQKNDMYTITFDITIDKILQNSILNYAINDGSGSIKYNSGTLTDLVRNSKNYLLFLNVLKNGDSISNLILSSDLQNNEFIVPLLMTRSSSEIGAYNYVDAYYGLDTPVNEKLIANDMDGATLAQLVLTIDNGSYKASSWFFNSLTVIGIVASIVGLPASSPILIAGGLVSVGTGIYGLAQDLNLDKYSVQDQQHKEVKINNGYYYTSSYYRDWVVYKNEYNYYINDYNYYLDSDFNNHSAIFDAGFINYNN